MTTVFPNIRRFTREEYHGMADAGLLTPSDRVELIHGQILEMSPIRSYHAAVVDILAELIIPQLQGKAILRIQNPLALEKHSEPEPDLAIVEYRKDRYVHQHPAPHQVHLIIEVAESSLRYDTVLKKELYAQFEIPHYWVLDLTKKQVLAFSDPSRGDYLNSTSFSTNDVLLFEKLDVKIPLNEVLYFE